MKSPPLSAALRGAAAAVGAVLAGRTPDTVLAGTAPAVRPAVLDLSYTTLRVHGRGDFLLSRLLEHPLKSRETRALLLVALARLEREPAQAHMIVDQAVSAAGKSFKGLVNAVLRNFLRRHGELLSAADAEEVARWCHPAWWLTELQAAYPQDWQAIATAGNSHPPMCLRLNRRRTPYGAFHPASADFSGRVLDDDAILLDQPVPVDRLPGFREGQLSVQDWGAQRAAVLLDARDGQRVLDACAAPGGKTAHLLERADLDLTALEQDPARAPRIAENLDRLGLRATVKVADASQTETWWDGRPFDRILADVPCSASGVVRRHPDIKWLRRPADVAGFARTQARILAALWPTLAPGGKMLYCTCSLFPAENARQIEDFTRHHADARRLPTGGDAPELQLLPTDAHDGFYYALLEKTP